MTSILDESVADKIVISNLLKELKKRGYMGKILIDPSDGKIYHAVQFEALTDEQLDKNVKESEGVIEDIARAREYRAKLSSNVTQPAPEATAPAEPVVPSAEPAPVSEPQPPVAPADPAPQLQ